MTLIVVNRELSGNQLCVLYVEFVGVQAIVLRFCSRNFTTCLITGKGLLTSLGVRRVRVRIITLILLTVLTVLILFYLMLLRRLALRLHLHMDVVMVSVRGCDLFRRILLLLLLCAIFLLWLSQGTIRRRMHYYASVFALLRTQDDLLLKYASHFSVDSYRIKKIRIRYNIGTYFTYHPPHLFS